MVVYQEELTSDRIKKRGGCYVDLIQGRVLLGVFMELKEDDTPRIVV
jgi:hypothetical protein